MTVRRVLDRNGLAEGDYADAGRHAANVNLALRVIADVRAERILRYESAMKLILGDLRRLEHDAVDENAIVERVCQMTGIEADDVAAVIRAFMSV
jgi:hypothetical protein